MEVALESIRHHYGSVEVIRDLSLKIDSGSLFSLLGPSGCGKTTLLRMLAGFVQPAQGRVRFAGQDVTCTPVHRREVGMVFQDYALFPDRSVLANVMFGLNARRMPQSKARSRALLMLERVGLSQYADHKPGELSGGQRQRVAMARALVIEPRLLLLDEPLSALDARLRVELRDLIKELQREFGTTTVFVTHDQLEAFAISDRIAVMDRGQVVQIDTPLNLYRQPDSRFVASFVGDANLLEIWSETHVNNGLRCFETAVGRVLSRARTPAAKGSCLVVRAESLDLQLPGESPSVVSDDASGGSGPDHCSQSSTDLPGVIETVEFRGSTVAYTVRMQQVRLHVQRWSLDHGPAFFTGQAVLVRIPVDTTVVTG